MTTADEYLRMAQEAQRRRAQEEAGKLHRQILAQQEAQRQQRAAAQQQQQAAQQQAAQQQQQQQEQAKPQPGFEPTGSDVLSVSRTSDPNKFIVKTQIPEQTPGVAKSQTMTRDQVIEAGGEIPTGEHGFWAQGILAERLGGREYRTEKSDAAADRQRQAELRDIADQIGWDGSIDDLLKEIKKDPDSPLWNLESEGGGLRVEEKARLFYEAGVEYEPRRDWEAAHVRVGIDTDKPAWVTKQEYERLKRNSPTLADLLKRKGDKALKATIRQHGREVDAAIRRDLQGDPYLLSIYMEKGTSAVADAIRKRERDIKDINLRRLQREDPYLHEILTTKGEKEYNEALDKRKSDMESIQKSFEQNHVQIHGLWIHRDDWRDMPAEHREIVQKDGWDAYKAQIDADNAKYEAYQAAIKKLQPYMIIPKKEGKTATMAVTAKTTTEKPEYSYAELQTLEPQYDIVKFLKENPGQEQSLIDAGYKSEDVKTASYFSKLNVAQRTWQSLTPWKEEKGEKATWKGASVMAAELAVPGVYTARHWDELSAQGKALQITMDVVCLAPWAFAGAAARGARAFSSVGRVAMIRGAAAEVGREALAQVRAPVTMIVHPIGTAKVTASQLRNLAENIFHGAKVPETVITTSRGFVMLPVKDGTTPAQAMAMRDILMERVARGENLIVKSGDQVVELPSSPLMREARKAGGSFVHVTDDIRDLAKGAKVEAIKGKPISEQGWFLSHEPATDLVYGRASGVETIPTPAGAKEKVANIARFKASDIAKLDKKPIRDLKLADARNIPDELSAPMESYIRENKGRVYGSYNEYVKIKGAKRPNDIDIAFTGSQDKHINDIIKLAEANGVKARRSLHSVEVYKNGKWVKLADIDTIAHHNSLIPQGLAQPAVNKINGLAFENMGEQYLRQSYGAVAADAKAGTRTQRINKAAGQVKKMISEAGVEPKVPGIFIVSKEFGEETVSTGKLWKAKEPVDLGLVAEMERKAVVGANIPKPAQKLYTRIGPSGLRVEIWLEKPLSPAQIARLKAESLVEIIKAPFKPAIIIKSFKKGVKSKRLTVTEVSQLRRIIKNSGNIRQARDLVVLGRVAARARLTPRSIRALTGNVNPRAITQARKRLEQSVVTRRARVISPERMYSDLRIGSREQLVRRTIARRETPSRVTPSRFDTTARARDKFRTGEAVRGTPLPRDTKIPREIRQPRKIEPPRRGEPPRGDRPPPRTPPPRTQRVPLREPPPRTPPPPDIPRPPKILKKGAGDSEKREFLDGVEGFVCRRRGQLHGKSVYRIHYYPYGDDDKLVLIGIPPRGAITVKGKGSVRKTAVLIKGKPPTRVIYDDTGAIDDVLKAARGKKILVTSVKDKFLR